MSRASFVAEVAGVAGRVAALLEEHGRTPLPEVLGQLAACHQELQAAVAAYPEPLAAGRKDRLGGELSGLMSYLQHVLVLYHNLDTIPEHLLAQASRDFGTTHQRARQVRDRSR